MKKIVLYGAGGFGREAAQIIEDINRKHPTYELLGFLDDGKDYHEGMIINGYPWLGRKEWILEHKEEVVCTCTIGNPAIKAKVQNYLSEHGVVFETIIANGAGVSGHSSLGPGCVLYPGAGVSVNCVIGAGVLINNGSVIGHDCVIGDYVAIMPGTRISGNIHIGSKASIGGMSYILPGKEIGEGAKVAPGSIVYNNVKKGTTVLGNPAKRVRGLE